MAVNTPPIVAQSCTRNARYNRKRDRDRTVSVPIYEYSMSGTPEGICPHPSIEESFPLLAVYPNRTCFSGASRPSAVILCTIGDDHGGKRTETSGGRTSLGGQPGRSKSQVRKSYRRLYFRHAFPMKATHELHIVWALFESFKQIPREDGNPVLLATAADHVPSDHSVNLP